MRQDLEETLLKVVGLILKAAARKALYAQKAKQDGRRDVSHLLRVIAESESVQARRLFNLLKGHIDVSSEYITTVFEEEIEALIDEYSENIDAVEKEGVPSFPEAMSQLRAAERRIRSFYSKEKKDVTVAESQYYVCKFCGYISVNKVPDSCPICTASREAFKEVA
jgi:rubrerythrin